MAEPIKPTNYISEVLTGQTAAQWEASGGSVYLQAFETVIESDTGKRKTGPGLFSELPYDNPQGQTWQNTAGTPTSADLIGYTAVTPAVTAEAEWTTLDAGTVGATIIVGNKLYTVVASGATGDEIDAGADDEECADNIATKVTTDTADTLCTAAAVGAVITFTANTTGAVGNSIPLSTTDEEITADVFVDGADAVYTPKTTTVDSLISNVITGTIDCSANPNYPAATKGDIYIVSAAGKIGGASGVTVEVGDWAVAIATNAGGTQAAVGASWSIIQTNITRPTSGYTTTATAAGTTTLTEASTYQQFFTGATTQTVVLPVVTTLQLGWGVYVVNNSSGAVTVNSSGANAVQVLAAGSRAIITCIALTGTGAASWSVTYLPAVSTVIANGDGNPISSDAVFDALALKADSQTVADATARLALTGLTRGARVYQTDTGFWYELTNAAAPDQGASWQAQPKVYKATLTQASTDPPVATVQENGLGQTMTWGYTSTGVYTVTAGAAAFTANQTRIFMGASMVGVGGMTARRTSTTVITVSSRDEFTPADDTLTETAITIEVYPAA